jgi:hypothetical protein
MATSPDSAAAGQPFECAGSRTRILHGMIDWCRGLTHTEAGVWERAGRPGAPNGLSQ